MNDLTILPPSSPPAERNFFREFTAFEEDIAEAYRIYRELKTNHANRNRPNAFLSGDGNYMISSDGIADLLEVVEDEAKRCQRQMQQIFPPDEDPLAPSTNYTIRRLTILAASYPAGAPPSPKTFYREMANHISLREPSIFAVESACREALETIGFIPNTKEMLPIIEKHTTIWQQRLQLMQDVANGDVRQMANELIVTRKQHEEHFYSETLKNLELIEQVAADQQDAKWTELAKFAARWRADESFTAEEWREIKYAVSAAQYIDYQTRQRRRDAKRAKLEHHQKIFLSFIGVTRLFELRAEYYGAEETMQLRKVPDEEIREALIKLHDDETQMANLAKLARPMKLINGKWKLLPPPTVNVNAEHSAPPATK